jgi:outer membrane autotransporter protein
MRETAPDTSSSVFAVVIVRCGGGGMMQGFVGYANDNVFANLSVGYSNINWNFAGPLTAARSATTGGVIGSLQAGMLWPMGDWRLGAMAELGYDAMTCSDGCLLAGTVEDISKWSGKATLRLDGKMAEGMLLPFVAVSFSDSLGGTNTVRNASAVVTTDTNSSVFNAKAGLTAMVADNTAVFIDGGISEGLSKDISGADGTAGLKVFW